MKSYLSLIPVSAKVHKGKNKMTQLCIFLAVLLVTGIFSMADMEIRSQKIRAVSEYGNWHISLRNLTEEEAGLIALRPDVEVSSWYNSLNYRLGEDYVISGQKVCVCGMEEVLLKEIMAKDLTEGAFPKEEGEALVLENARDSLGIKIGDTVTMTVPSGGEREYRITGFAESEALVSKMDAVVLCLPVEYFKELYRQEKQDGLTDADMVYYVRFKKGVNLRKAIEDVKTQYQMAEEEVGENTMLLGVSGASLETEMTAIYGAAVVLFLLVLLAGTLMIASSMNSNIAQRTAFFGMLHCIGADKRQTMRFVRMEALYWCRLAIPAGVGLSVLAGPILLLLYPARQETALAATYHLQLLGIASVFVCIMLLTNSIMQAHGKVNWPIITMLIGGAVKVGINYVLVGDPEINIKGAPIGTLICYGLIALINLALVSRLLEKKPNYPAIFAKPVIASAIMGAAAWASHGLLGKVLYGGYMKSSLCTMLSMGIAVVVYLILVITLGMITREDLRMVPHGAKLAKILHL